METCRIPLEFTENKRLDLIEKQMGGLANEGFILLYKEAFEKCFGHALTEPISETESRHFGNSIFEATGLVIGAKSLKNYSGYILDPKHVKTENPSTATLDTLARYVTDAPYTDELQRKKSEGHYPYWFAFNSKAHSLIKKEKSPNGKTIIGRLFVFSLLLALVAVICFIMFTRRDSSESYLVENFTALGMDSLENHGWLLKSEDTTWWDKRNINADHLTLFTLKGDNWADSMHGPGIRNLLITKTVGDCFEAEIHLDDFAPLQNWEQAGIVLLEDSNFSGKSLRLSLAYNDFFGGFKKPGEIIIQAIMSSSLDPSKPEEILHLPVFIMDSAQINLIGLNFRKTALKIEKKGNHLRFLYAVGSVANFAYREALSKQLDIHPKWIGLFAIKGFVENDINRAVKIKFFSIRQIHCD